AKDRPTVEDHARIASTPKLAPAARDPAQWCAKQVVMRTNVNRRSGVPHVDEEIASQPACWGLAVELAARSAEALPRPGERVAVLGCGTSWFMAMAYAALREAAGHGDTDAFAA